MEWNEVDLVKKVYEIVSKEKLFAGHYDKSKKVIDFVPPESLSERLGGLTIEKDGIADVDLLLENVVKYSVKTCHSHFYNQLYHGSHPAGLAGQVSTLLFTKDYFFR